ncbi:AAA family ATPase [Agarivorans sp. B2Z047]|uniref:AAA family ATPase n=1 Tax=Agarivorans sp. B2Z047 TaxID=2652721 RepID=UPI00128DAC7D|nr:AAA family ATPase [Agarivorans sp. B2Z047]MPW30484.1 AAA family ATPase [Agarivorans sp. B2Z047]UQN42296.1 AAA family ATPase [Agarivorans sp. B2Z047]
MDKVTTLNPHQRTVDAVNEVIKSAAITANQVAKEVGLSPAVISGFLKGSYGGNNDAVNNKLKNWLEVRDSRLQQIVNRGYVETHSGKQIHTALQYAHAASCITVVFGISGVGKTFAAREYARLNNNCWMITASPSASSLSECLYEIALELGMSDAPRRKGPLCRALARRLTDTGGLLIVDEADHLGYDALEELRILQEKTNIGLTLIGNDRVYSQLTGGRRSEEFARLFSRLAKKTGLHKTKQNDVIAIAKSWGIEGKKERQFMQKVAERPGALRLLNMTLRIAAITAYGQEKPITLDHLRAALADLES